MEQQGHKAMIFEALFDVQKQIEQRQWQPLAEGVFVSTLYQSGESSSRSALLRYLPGASVPRHLHAGIEYILILQGSQIDGDLVYETGTLVIHNPGTDHAIVSPEGCVALGIWEKPVVFQ